MEKRLVYPQYNLKGERDVFSVTEDRRWLQKTAGNYHPEIQAYIQNAKPMPDLIQVLLTALGAHEYWGQNVNGDRFYEAALKNPGSDYGYKTFLTNANYFTHHVNKDPALAKGKVLATVWNDAAKRVELVVGINPSLDPDAASMLDNGEALCFSMGARLPFDVCTVCGNKAKTRAEYCDHLKYQMNQIDPGTGVLVGAINPTPKFFDISRVLIPADKTAYMWEKIAHATNSPLSKVGSAQLAHMTIKQALSYEPEIRKTASAQKKTAEIKKQIIAISHPKAVEKLKEALTQVKHALDASAPEIPMEVFRGGPTPDQCVGSMALLGLVPTASERAGLVDLFTREDGHWEMPQVGPHSLNLALIKRLLPYIQERSFFRPILMRRITVMQKEASVEAGAAVGASIAQGVLQALGSFFGTSDSIKPGVDAVKKMPSEFSALIAKHPALAGVLAAIIMNRIHPVSKPFKTSGPLVSGNFTVADPTQGLYNNDWQRRFVEMQNRPVAVIKTGAAQQIDNLVSPLTYLLMSVDLVKTAEEQRTWEMVADQFLSKIKSNEYQQIIKSASTITSGNTDEMADTVPEIADIQIIKHVMKLASK